MRASLLVLAACARLPSATPAGQTVALAPGSIANPNELMEFRVSLRGITVGLVQTAIGKPGWVAGRHAIILRSRGQADGLAAVLGDLTWELTTTLDLERGTPIEDHEESWMAAAGEHEHDDQHHTWRADEQRHDAHSAIGALRAWQSGRGDRVEIQLAIGGGHFAVELWNAGREYVRSAHKPAVRYDGVAADEFRFAIWLSDDVARVPLAFHADSPLGVIAIDLVDYQVPPS